MDYPVENYFSIDEPDEKIVETFTSWFKESQTYHDELLRKQKISYEYYIGNQTDRDRVPEYLSDTVENRIFEAVETLVPVVTGAAHQFQVAPGSEDEKSKDRADRLQKVLARKYDTLEMQKKLEDVARYMLVMRFGVMKYLWDTERDDVDVKVIDPRLILVPKLRVDPHRLPYVMEIQEYTRDELKENFPKANDDDFSYTQKIDTGNTRSDPKKTKQVFEVWTDDMVAWIADNKVLEKMENPYYDYKGVEKKQLDERGRIKKVTKFYNHLDMPEKPYVFFAPFNISDGSLPSISLVEVAMPIQDAINVQKRRIINNLSTMGNGQVYADSEAMTQEEADNMTNEPGLVIRGPGIASEGRIKREAGVPLPGAHFSNLQHSETVFDNLMGVHSATRGAANAKTLGQDILSRQQDFTRVDTVTRVLNRGMARLANGLVQLMKLFYTEQHVVKIIGEQAAIEFVKLNQDDIEDYVEILVRSGQNLPMDEVSLRSEAVQLWQLGALDPVTLFERLKFPSPAMSAERLLAWKTGQLTQETQAKIAQAQGAAEASAANAPPQSTGSPEGRQPGSGAPSGIETPMNVLQRARANLGGSSPVQPAGNVRR